MHGIVRECRKAIQNKMQASISLEITCATALVETNDGFIRITTDFYNVNVVVSHYRRPNAHDSENLIRAIKKAVPSWRCEVMKKIYSLSDTYNLDVDCLC